MRHWLKHSSILLLSTQLRSRPDASQANQSPVANDINMPRRATSTLAVLHVAMEFTSLERRCRLPRQVALHCSVKCTATQSTAYSKRMQLHMPCNVHQPTHPPTPAPAGVGTPVTNPGHLLGRKAQQLNIPGMTPIADNNCS
jgi:hypothetical protein